MSKQKRSIIAVVLCLITLTLSVGIFFITNKKPPENNNESEIVSSDAYSNMNIEDIESNNETDITSSSKGELDFLEPDETKADEILEESKKNKNASSVSKPADTTTRKKEIPKDNSSKNQASKPSDNSSVASSSKEEKTELETETENYLKEHNIDPKTAGETGERCKHCGKKIWNPDKYGFFIPGMPENYETSDYCLGTCGIVLE